MTEWIQQTLSILLPFIGTALGAVILYLCYQAITYLKQKGLEEQVVEALRQAVDHTQEQYVDWWKDASEDGKLSKEERQQALGIAKQTALRLLDGPARDMAYTWTTEKIDSIIRRILDAKQKAEPIVIEERYEISDIDNPDPAVEAPAPISDESTIATANGE